MRTLHKIRRAALASLKLCVVGGSCPNCNSQLQVMLVMSLQKKYTFVATKCTLAVANTGLQRKPFPLQLQKREAVSPRQDQFCGDKKLPPVLAAAKPEANLQLQN